jgi:hypothetical protein
MPAGDLFGTSAANSGASSWSTPSDTTNPAKAGLKNVGQWESLMHAKVQVTARFAAIRKGDQRS